MLLFLKKNACTGLVMPVIILDRIYNMKRIASRNVTAPQSAIGITVNILSI